jgi:hypothetical protein
MDIKRVIRVDWEISDNKTVRSLSQTMRAVESERERKICGADWGSEKDRRVFFTMLRSSTYSTVSEVLLLPQWGLKALLAYSLMIRDKS